MVQKTMFSECTQLSCHGWRRVITQDILCSVSPQLMKRISEITQEEFEQPKGAKTSCCAVISIREPLPINSTIISSSKGLQSEKSKGGGFY